MDSLEVEIALRDIRLAYADSTRIAEREYFEEEINIQSEARKRIIKACKESEPSFVERLIKQPVIWLALGVWLGVQAN